MYLQRLELQGFKSFANKTTLEFPKGKKITSIVGPNGSGKSCVADAIRWVLGEQSMKLLRAKKGTEVVFSGSEKRARSGFAEVSIYLDNSEKRGNVPYSEIVITRRLYRSGENEYYLNKNRVKLQDILLLLAQANFGQRAYSVIGQGMIDAVLIQSPRERKDFFDEATGVKQFQIKRMASINKLKATEDNLRQVDVLLAEVRPRIKGLFRQVSKLEQHDEIKDRLHSAEHSYYGSLWHKLNNDFIVQKEKITTQEKALNQIKEDVAKFQKEFESQEKEEGVSEELLALQAKYNELINKKNILREKEFFNKEKISNFKLKNTSTTTISTTQILVELENIAGDYERMVNSMSDNTDVSELKQKLTHILEKIKDLNKRIKNPKEVVNVPEELETLLSAILKDVEKIDNEIKNIQGQINQMREKQKNEQSDFFSLQRKWRDKIEEKNTLESRVNELKINIARVETRKESLEEEMETFLKERKERIISSPPQEKIDINKLENEIQNLRYQLELIGNIDPETIKEYKEAKERYDFLESQSVDLTQAIKQLKEIIKELDIQTKEQFDKAFKKINDEFGKFFTILFGGGKARLELTETDKNTNSSENEDEDSINEKPEEVISGVEIFANPPGKKLSAVNMLSGGERAMTSIALISAIISNNPSPFVVLDEVDAALDESNSIRFAEIVKQLVDKTQFILITHNRSTMSIASVLYGVSMGDDGASQLLSLKLEEAEGLVNR